MVYGNCIIFFIYGNYGIKCTANYLTFFGMIPCIKGGLSLECMTRVFLYNIYRNNRYPRYCFPFYSFVEESIVIHIIYGPSKDKPIAFYYHHVQMLRVEHDTMPAEENIMTSSCLH